MAVDGILIKSVVKELKEKLENGKVQKIYQINDHLVIINIYNNKNNYRLLISSNPQNSRIHLTNQEYKNPTKAPQFSMILRKHIQNSTIKEINQISLDRSIEIILDGKDEIGVLKTKKLVIDIMGKYSNIVLVDENNTVIEAIKRISHEMSSVRAVYPGTKFNKLIDDKINILEKKVNIYDLDIPDNFNLKKVFYTNFTGFGPQIGNEIVYRANISLDKKYGQLTEEEINSLNNSFQLVSDDIKESKFSPKLYYSNDKVDDFYCFELTHKGNFYNEYDSISEIMDIYYKENVNDNSLNQAKENLQKQVENIHLKNINKLDNLNSDYKKSLDYDLYRIEGDLLSSVAYSIEKGQSEIEVFNYYENENVIIKLNPKKSPWQNIELKYKISKKLHTSNKMLESSIPNLENEIKYLKNVINQIKNIETHDELAEIKDELIDQKYIKKSGKKGTNKKENNKASEPFKFTTKNNNIIYVGKNNKQNEYLTLREANGQDYFFHIKDRPGAHVILKNLYEIDENEIYAAAYLAANYSKNNDDRYIDVDYTQKKNVNKAKGSKPGMVYYTNFSTIRVDIEDKPKNL